MNSARFFSFAFLKNSIRLRLLVVILVAGSLPVAVFGLISSLQAERILKEDARLDTTLMLEQKAIELDQFFQLRADAVTTLASDVRMSRYIRARGRSPDINHEVMKDWTARALIASDFDDILLVDREGTVHYSAREGAYPDQHLADEPWRSTAAGQAFLQRSTEESENASSRLAGFIFVDERTATTAAVSHEGELLGWVIGTVTINLDSPFYRFDIRSHGSLELVVGMETPSGIRFLSTLHKENGDSTVVARKGVAEPMQLALAGESGSGVMRDYVGDQVIASWRRVPGQSLGIVVKVDYDEVMEPIQAMQRASIPALILILGLLVSVSAYISSVTSRRVRRLDEAATLVQEGNVNVRIEEDGDDEIGSLIRSFNAMTTRLHETLASRKELEREVTHRKKLEAEARQYVRELEASNKDLEQFAYVASHDLQEPLRMVASYTELLERRYANELDDDAREFVAYAANGARRMQQLINDLLQLSRISTGGKPFETVDMQEITARAWAQARMVDGGSDALFVSGDLPMLVGDASQLERLMTNLFSNAIKFRSEDPCLITVNATPSSDEWIFAVKDNGIGIDPQYGERIFLIFQRLHTSAEYPGTGLGLAICKRIIQRHNGRIWVESTADPHRGSTFKFAIPKKPLES